MGIHSSKALIIPMSAVLDKVTTKDIRKELKEMIKTQVIRLRPEMEFDKKGLNKMIKDGMKHAQFTLDKNNKIKTLTTTVAVSPVESLSISADRKKAVKKHEKIDPRTGLAELDEKGNKIIVPHQKAKLELTGVAFKTNAIAPAKLYGQTIKDIISLKKQMTEAEIAGNIKGRKSLEENLKAVEKRRDEYQAVMKKDQSTKVHSNTLARSAYKIEQGDIANTNKLIGWKTKLISGNVKQIEKLKTSQKGMNKGDASYKESVQQIRALRKENSALVGDSQALNNVKNKGYANMKNNLTGKTEADEVNRYNKAMGERLKFDKEIGTLIDKQKKGSGANTVESRKLISSLVAEREERVKTMQTIEQTSKGKANESIIEQQRLKYLNANNLIQERTEAGSAKTKNFLRDIMNGWKDAAARVIDYTIAYRALWGGISLIKSGIQTIYDLNKAFTDIQMVTGMTTTEVNILADSYAKLAQDYGATIQQVAQGATEWLRQGKSVADTTDLLQQSMIMSKVGAMDSAKATEYLTSTLNGYKMGAKEASKIVDTFSALDMAAATSTEELAIAFQRSANSAHDSGIAFEKLASYITVVSETTRKSASTIGESFKTLSARYMNVKLGVAVDPESGENINDTEKALKTVNIAIRDSKNTWRDFEDVIDEVGGKWDEYNEMQKNTIVTAMAGVRQAENFRALMNNFPKVGKYMTVVAESAGSSAKKYETYMDSLEAKQNKLISTFQEIAYQPVFESLYKTILDLLTVLGQLGNVIANNAISMTAFGAAIALAVISIKKFEATLLGILAAKVTDWAASTAAGFMNMTTQAGMSATKIASLTFKARALMLAMSPVGLVAIAVGIGLITKAWSDNTTNLEEALKKAQDLQSQYETLTTQIEELVNKSLQTNSKLSPEEVARLDWLMKYKETLQDAARLANSDAALQLFYGEGDLNPFTTGILDKPKSPLNARTAMAEAMGNVDIGKMTKAQADELALPKNASKMQNVKKQYDDLLATQSDLMSQQEQLREKLGEDLTKDATDRLTKDLNNINTNLSANETIIQKLRDLGIIEIEFEVTPLDTKPVDTSLSTAITDMQNAVATYSEQLIGLTEIQDKLNNGQTLTRKEMEDVIALYPELEDDVIKLGKGYGIEEGAIRDLLGIYKKTANESKATSVTRIKAEIKTTEEILKQIQLQIDGYNILGDAMGGFRVKGAQENYDEAVKSGDKDLIKWTSQILNTTKSKKEATQKIIDDANAEINSMLNSVEDVGVGNDATGTSDDPHIKAFEKKYAILENLRDISEISEAEYYNRLELLNKEFYTKTGKYAEEYIKYESEIYKGREKLWKDDYDKKLAYSKKYMDANKEEWSNATTVDGDSEISALLRIKASLEAFYADAKKNHKMYLADIEQDLNETILSIEEATKSLVSNLKDTYGQSLLDSVQAKIDKLENKRLNDSVISGLEKQITTEENKLKLLEAQDDELAKQTAEIKAQKELIDALSRQKDVRVYSAEKGWTWEQDRTKIVEEQTKLTTMESDLQKAQIQKVIDTLENKLEEANKVYDDQIKVLQKTLDNQTYLYNLNKDKTVPTIESTITELLKLGGAGKETAEALLIWVNKLRADIGLPAIKSEELDSYVPTPTPTPAPAPVPTKSNQRIYLDNLIKNGTAGQKAWAKAEIAAGRFDEGGVADGVGSLRKDTIKPERVLSPIQTQDFGKLVAYLPKIMPSLDMFSVGGKSNPLLAGATDNSVSIQNLTINAPNGATLQSLLAEAKNIAKINKR